MTSYWSIGTLILYLIVAAGGEIFFYKGGKLQLRNNKYGIIYRNRYYISFIVVFSTFAAARYVNRYGIGGTDAHSYVEFFQSALSGNIIYQWQHYEVLYKIITMACRVVTSNYHVFFLIVYGFIAYSYVRFILEFRIQYQSVLPLMLVIFVYVEGFNTLRTTFATAFILNGLIWLYRGKNIRSIVWMVTSCLIHISAIFYAAFVIVYIFFKEKINAKRAIIVSLGSAAAAYVARRLLIGHLVILNGGHNYAYYARQSVALSFFDNYWKIAFEQLVLLAVFLIYRSKIYHKINILDQKEREKAKFVIALCYYDFALIPLTYVLNIWRAPEVFYIPRLLLWGILLRKIKDGQTNSGKKIVSLITIVVMISWLCFRWYNIWKTNDLMPYIFAPFVDYNGLG